MVRVSEMRLYAAPTLVQLRARSVPPAKSAKLRAHTAPLPQAALAPILRAEPPIDTTPTAKAELRVHVVPTELPELRVLALSL